MPPLHYHAALLLLVVLRACGKPNVILLIADDLGFNDVSWHDPSVQSPHLERLARDGLILNRSYMMPTCTPSRSAMLTGRYPFKLGTQHEPLGDSQPHGIPTDFTLLPAYLKQVGYRTHLVGKWHLGFCKNSFMPTRRGFDTHYGTLCGFGDHFNHTTWPTEDYFFTGYDFRDNLQPVRMNKYSMDAYADRVSSLIRSHDRKVPLFLMYSFQNVHFPLQAPKRFYDMYPHVQDENRRMYLAMVTSMDDAVGRLVTDLKAADLFNDTYFFFSSDNGGMSHFGAYNYPLRGFKDSLLEGGIRVPAFISSPRLANKGRVENGYVHVVDWAPTILDLAGFDYGSLQLDGVSHARTLLEGQGSKRQGFVVNIDEISKSSAIVNGSWKLIVGNACYKRAYRKYNLCYDDWKKKGWKYALFNIKKDPSEEKNVASQYPKVRAALQRELQRQSQFLRKSGPSAECPLADPRRFGGFYSPGWCEKGSYCDGGWLGKNATSGMVWNSELEFWWNLVLILGFVGFLAFCSQDNCVL